MKPDRELVELMLKDAPDILVRVKADSWSQGIFTSAFLESVNPKPKSFRIGGKVVYKKRDFIKWLEEKYGIEGIGDDVQGCSTSEKGP